MDVGQRSNIQPSKATMTDLALEVGVTEPRGTCGALEGVWFS
jgi:hypothetical protein